MEISLTSSTLSRSSETLFDFFNSLLVLLCHKLWVWGWRFNLVMERGMDRLNTPLAADQLRFTAYLEALSGVLGHADRIAPLKAYCTGLLLPGARKSIEPMAARIAPARVQATPQALHHFVAKGEWSDSALVAH